jgi:hypothetical protein
MPKIRWAVVTIHGGSLLSPIFQGYPQDDFTLPPKLRGGSHSEVRVYIVELSSISTTCGLYYDYLKPLTPLIHNGESL